MLAGAIALLPSLMAEAQTPPARPGGGLVILDFKPAMDDLMTMLVQPRHIKLGLAGNARNWAYAAYELGELRETFDDVATRVPRHDNLPIPDMIAATVRPPMAALDRAIGAKDAAAFTKAYADLTAACNACHAGMDHAFLVIKVPDGANYPDQEFRP